MKRLLVISDTHKNLKMLANALENNLDCDTIIHLGDNYEDIDNFMNILKNKEIYKVPGIFHPNYLDGTLPKYKIIYIEDKKVLITHSLNDIKESADIYLIGHTHNWELSTKKGGEIYFNPGHLHIPEEKGRIATYGIIVKDKNYLIFYIFNFRHEKILEAKI